MKLTLLWLLACTGADKDPSPPFEDTETVEDTETCGADWTGALCPPESLGAYACDEDRQVWKGAVVTDKALPEWTATEIACDCVDEGGGLRTGDGC
ncbi:MAG: hypothetical protein H6742_18695 [Alphaproteobacteria bacterium]|nr:hypothetical protein [Alphaproteobacteria bacterium]